MKHCPHCSYAPGHYASVTYKCINGDIHTQSYWFCHTCAHKVYDDEQNYEESK